MTDLMQAETAVAMPRGLTHVTGAGAAGAARPAPAEIRRRRRLVLALNVATVAALLAAMVAIMAHAGFTAFEGAMLVPFALTLPWLSIGFWNALIGWRLDRRHADAAAYVTPAVARAAGAAPVTARTAIVMPLRNEDPEASLDRLAAVEAALAATPWADRFDYHVLSDSDRPEIAAREQRLVAAWRARRPGARIAYRRRTENGGYKAGNIAEFVNRCHRDYEFFLPLDADSAMSGEAVLRLVRIMQASPEMGMLQGLVVGMPSQSFFTRAFQFGMRHGMRSYTLGSAWWQADCGPSWGHNMLIRMAPFHAHCMLPRLPGDGPLGGDILSHDQVEAALMRAGGYECRVLAEEDESFEINPPSLVDFIRRELRWCNGNMQYLRLLGLKGLAPVSRVQLLLAIQMYVSAPAWILFILMGAGLAGVGDHLKGVPLWIGLGFFAVVMALNLMPKLMGLAQVLARPEEAARYGGRGRVVAGGAAEILFSMLVAPSVAVALALFLAGLPFGRRVGWQAQQRDRSRLLWSEAARCLWPQTALGLGLTAWLSLTAAWALPFAVPVLAALALSIPLAVLSTAPALGRWSARRGLFAIPEERHGGLDTAPACHSVAA